MKNFPIGIQTFSKIIENDYYYIDKTPLIHQLTKESGYYFLSRPRRFGKSLLVSTLASAFRCEQALFNGLYLEHNWDFSKPHPVIDISLGRGDFHSVSTLQQRFRAILDEIAEDYHVSLQQQDLANRFAELIRILYQLEGRSVVILVDEYDKPILDSLDTPEQAIAIRDELKSYYSIIKNSDKYIRFVLLTGVSKFSKVALFSGLNNLKDISLDSRYATLCGYTETEIKNTFAEHLHDVDLNELRRWYNGYNFLGEKVYNPFDVLLYLDSKRFENYWFETGSPSFLLKLVRNRQFPTPDIEKVSLSKAELGTFDVNSITLETLLFQTGYLTIESVENFAGETMFNLTYPNHEVKVSLNQHLLKDLTQTLPSQIIRNRIQIYKALEKADFESLKNAFQGLFAGIPNDWYRKNQLANYEGYYASIIYSCFCALGGQVIAEDCTNHGRIDLTLIYENKLFIFEFKVLDSDDRQGTALEQIKQKNYQQKYLDSGNELFLVGMEFDREQRNLTFFEWERL